MEDVIKKYEHHIVDEKTQKRLNEPVKDETGLDEDKAAFLKMLIEKIEKKEINVHDAQTLYNHSVYDALSEADQEKADLTGVNIISIIRQIEAIWKQDQKTTFQIQNLVETVLQMKSDFEAKYGDVYII